VDVNAAEELLAEQLDRLESVVSTKDAELRKLKIEFELRNLYVSELHATLERQAGQLEELEGRLRRLEEGRSNQAAGQRMSFQVKKALR